MIIFSPCSLFPVLTDKERYTNKRNRDVRIVSQYRVGWWVNKIELIVQKSENMGSSPTEEPTCPVPQDPCSKWSNIQMVASTRILERVLESFKTESFVHIMYLFSAFNGVHEICVKRCGIFLRIFLSI